MDEKDKEILTLQFARMEEMIKGIAIDTQETKEDVKETKQDVKGLDKRVRDIEEMVRAQDTKSKLDDARISKLERLTSVTGFFSEHPKLTTTFIILLLAVLALTKIDANSLISLIK